MHVLPTANTRLPGIRPSIAAQLSQLEGSSPTQEMVVTGEQPFAATDLYTKSTETELPEGLKSAFQGAQVSHFPYPTREERRLDLLRQEQRSEPVPFDFKQDLRDQSAWLVQECRARFNCTPDELLQRPNGSERFNELAVEWREAHPRS